MSALSDWPADVPIPMSIWEDDFAKIRGELEAQVASLTAERDRLREAYDLLRVERDQTAAMVKAHRKADEIIRAERDAALASLAAEREQTARMRTVVEAARAWASDGPSLDGWRIPASGDHIEALLAAVAALDAGAATGGEDE